MSQHDYNIANGGGAAVRADINNALLAVLSQNSGATAPATTKPFMLWYDTANGVIKQRNAADSAWVTGPQVDASGNVVIGTGSPSFVSTYGGLQVHGPNGATIKLTNPTTGATSADGFELIVGAGNSDAYVWQRESANLIFGTSNAERARFDSSGNLLLGTASNSGKLSVVNGANTNRAMYVEGYPSGLPTTLFYRDNTDAQYVMQIRHDNAVSASTGLMIQFVNQGGTGVGSITSTGSATSYVTSSDYRLKENIAPMTGALDAVAQLKPCTYTWKDGGLSGQGFIAHELAEVVPECVVGEKDATRIEQYEISPAVPATFDEQGNEMTPAVEAVMGQREVPSYQGIDTSFLVATLTAAIQEQQAIINQLRADVDALKSA